VVVDLVDHLLGGGAADLGLRAGAEALGHPTPIWMMRSASESASACASVLATTKSHAFELGLDHVVDGVAAGPADAEDGDARLELGGLVRCESDCHFASPISLGSVRNAPAAGPIHAWPARG
jgi:hypothetical protein